MSEEDKGFAIRLKLRLDQLGISQSKLADRVGVSGASVSQWLAGKKSPSKESIEQIAAIVKVTPEWLAYGAGPAPLLDLDPLRSEYEQATGWRFRVAPPDGGRDYGNANVWAFDPSIAAMVRDVLQNCRDAELSPGAAVHVVFRIIRLRGSDLEAFRKAAKWDEVLHHLRASAKINQRLGRLIRHHLKRAEKSDELLLLVVHDYGTIGLLGDEFGKGNFAALCRNNLDSDKQSGSAGGAFGLGKAVLWRVSQFSLVLFGSHLSAPMDGGRQFSRVFGRCDLPWHEIKDPQGTQTFGGPGWFGSIEEDDQERERAVSFWDNEALMHDLYLHREQGLSGTSIAVVGFHDPSDDQNVDPPALADKIESAVADWFWPDLTEGRLGVRVEIWDGRKQQSATDVLAEQHRPEYVEAYQKWKADDTVEQLIKEGDVVAKRVTLKLPARVEDPKHPEIEHEGTVLVRRAGDNAASDRTNELAMFRSVRMVVQYKSLKGICIGALPFHAALICGEAAGTDAEAKMADRFLRTSEPPAHHEWGSTPDLQTEYKRGGATAIKRLLEDAKAAIREAVRPSIEDRSDGPRSLKELLKIGELPEPKDRPRVTRPTAEVSADGSWTVDARIRVRRSDYAWRVEPIVTFRQETGGGVPVAWRKLEAVDGCTLQEDRLLIPAGTTEVRFRGETDPTSHPVDALECCVTVDVRRAQRERGAQV